MSTIGVHILLDVYDVDFSILNDRDYLHKYLKDLAAQAGLTVLNHCFHTFDPQGLSGVLLLSESHVSIHTWPESGVAAIDLYSCKVNVDVAKIMELTTTALKTLNIHKKVLYRGVLP